jgi:hypothetical protein
VDSVFLVDAGFLDIGTPAARPRRLNSPASGEAAPANSTIRDMPKTFPIAFWLVPASPDHRALSQRIAALAAEHDAPAFEPHITLHVGVLGEGESVDALLSQVAHTAAAMTLTAGATAHSDQQFKALYVEFDDSRLHRIHQALRECLSVTSSYRLAPHLSLLYKRLPHAQREALAQRQRLAGQLIAFDTLVAVRPAAGCSDLSEVSAWDTALRRALRSPAA